MTTSIQAIAALIWRFAGVFLILQALPAFVAAPFTQGYVALPMVLSTTAVMAVGTAFIVFSRHLGAYVSFGL